MAGRVQKWWHAWVWLLACSACGGGGGAGNGDADVSGSDTSSPTATATSTGPGDTSGETGTETSDTAATDDGTTTGTCQLGEIVCEGDQAKTCDGMGGFDGVEDCGPLACIEGFGCAVCQPGTLACNDGVSEICNEVGDGWTELEECDEIQGLSCDQMTGKCVGECTTEALGQTNLGCDFYPTQPQNGSYDPGYEFAVTIANTSGQPAQITITRGGDIVTELVVDADDVALEELPWVDELSHPWPYPTELVPDGAYRLRSTRPVAVAQYNTVPLRTGGDASTLLPVHVWRDRYIVASWPPLCPGCSPPYYSVVARDDGTTVSLTPSATGGQVNPGGGVEADGTGEVALDRGDVLQVMTESADLTGTIVTADKRIQVFGGAGVAAVPNLIGEYNSDPIVETMVPVEMLSSYYIVVPPAQDQSPTLDRPQFVRVVATEDDTPVVFDPPQGVPGLLGEAGDFVEVPWSTGHMSISSTKKILVAQYMVSQPYGYELQYGVGDPSLLVTVPPEHYKTEYLFHSIIPAVNNAENLNNVDIVAPTGAAVVVDGVVVVGWTAIGQTGYALAHVALSNAGGGNHSVVSDQAVGITVYGYQPIDFDAAGRWGSYWYPGGLDFGPVDG